MVIRCDIALMNTNPLTAEPRTGELQPLTIRFATESDELAVMRLAALDSAAVPAKKIWPIVVPESSLSEPGPTNAR